MGNFEQRQRLKQLLLDFMKGQNLTGHALARRMGISQGATQSWLNGTAYPGKENRELIAQTLGRSYEELQSYLEDRAIAPSPTKTADEICREIRLLPREDLPQVARALTERLIGELSEVGDSAQQR
jgi:transcriptional regulator with XRE-family HTH domain